MHLQHRDVCKDGFGIDSLADAVFLDLPAPWEAVPHAKQSLKAGELTRICCFSPCVEQVQRTCTALREFGFFDVEMFEVLIKESSIFKIEGVKKFSLHPSEYKQSDDGTFCTKRSKNYESSSEEKSSSRLIVRPNVEIKGHTSYLTFASLLK